jgi:excinuclease UvrABC nuclease subunit
MAGWEHSLFESCVQLEPGAQPVQSIDDLPHCRGVVLFADADDTPILLLTAADIKRLAINRLTCADTTITTKRVKLADITRKIYYRCCWCDFSSSLEHYRIAKELFPSRYHEMVTFPKIWYVKINCAAKWPNFTITDNPEDGKQDVHIFGPLPARKAAGDYISTLNEAFGLCRQQCLVDDSAKAASCPYYQMGTCDAPCLGKTNREAYLCRIQHAVEAAGGSRQEHIQWFNDTMRTLAAQMKFEEAQRTKKQLEHFKQLDDPTYRWVCELRELKILHIDAGPKIKIKGQKKKTQSYMAFLIQGGVIMQLENFTTEQVPQLLETVSATVNRLACETSTQNIAEQMSLVGFALYRSKPSGLWLDCRKIPRADELTHIISKKFIDDSAGGKEDVGGKQQRED